MAVGQISQPEAPRSQVDVLAARDLLDALAFIGRSNLQRLDSELHESEALLQLAWVVSPYFATGLFALTDERIIFVRKRRMRDVFKVQAIALEDIREIEVGATGGSGAMTLFVHFVHLSDRGRGRFIFTSEAKNRDALIELLRSLPQERRRMLHA